MESAQKSHSKVEVKLFLHPDDHHRALAAAKTLKLAEREFFALALHLGANQILRQSDLA
ncbi:hypothetical protein [Paraburkholderia lycopersici]|uniref:Uncharacterized protein n=1 Tax=Paraburkholderia lycopersici TaxID=416944 RepID=A0A1G6N113_9BURK|nr:hypothetical protein [Paraburkholderia lycopersici]SDC61522.1 hypothetical protein SAMN05421548_108162 [Paraburkholderia lycopersici]